MTYSNKTVREAAPMFPSSAINIYIIYISLIEVIKQFDAEIKIHVSSETRFFIYIFTSVQYHDTFLNAYVSIRNRVHPKCFEISVKYQTHCIKQKEWRVFESSRQNTKVAIFASITHMDYINTVKPIQSDT